MVFSHRDRTWGGTTNRNRTLGRLATSVSLPYIENTDAMIAQFLRETLAPALAGGADPLTRNLSAIRRVSAPS
jgi:hypothetical protein